MSAPAFHPFYFAQGEEAAAALDYVEEHGAAAWLDMLSGAMEWRDCETVAAPPWGRADRLVHVETLAPGETVRVHIGPGQLYISATLETLESSNV